MKRNLISMTVVAAMSGAAIQSHTAVERLLRPSRGQTAVSALSKDIYPESGNRLPLIKREDLAESDRQLYDSAAGDSRSLAGLRGPAGLQLWSPRLTEYSRRRTSFLRFESGFDARLSELAILVTARELDQQFEWTAHEPSALGAGLERRVIDVVKYRRSTTDLGSQEATIIQLGREAIGRRRVEPATFARALELFGKERLVNLVALMGHYSAIAVLLDTFDQHLAPGQTPLLPIP
jgi:4-carboxymuconolactone decarboxylase